MRLGYCRHPTCTHNLDQPRQPSAPRPVHPRPVHPQPGIPRPVQDPPSGSPLSALCAPGLRWRIVMRNATGSTRLVSAAAKAGKRQGHKPMGEQGAGRAWVDGEPADPVLRCFQGSQPHRGSPAVGGHKDGLWGRKRLGGEPGVSLCLGVSRHRLRLKGTPR